MDKGQRRPASRGNKYGHYERSCISLWTPEGPQPNFSLNRNPTLDTDWSNYSQPKQWSISVGDTKMVSFCYSTSTWLQFICSSNILYNFGFSTIAVRVGAPQDTGSGASKVWTPHGRVLLQKCWVLQLPLPWRDVVSCIFFHLPRSLYYQKCESQLIWSQTAQQLYSGPASVSCRRRPRCLD